MGVCILTELTSLHLVMSAVMGLPGALFNSIQCVHQKAEDQINTFSLCLQAQSFNLVSSWMFLHYINIWSCFGLCFASTNLGLGLSGRDLILLQRLQELVSLLHRLITSRSNFWSCCCLHFFLLRWCRIKMQAYFFWIIGSSGRQTERNIYA